MFTRVITGTVKTDVVNLRRLSVLLKNVLGMLSSTTSLVVANQTAMTKARKEKEYYAFVEEWKTQWKPDLDALGGYNGLSCDPTRVPPSVIQWTKDHISARSPHFVKIINKNAVGTRSPKHFAVPIPFVQEHFRELDRVNTLEDEEGKTWRVSFGAPRKQPIWHQGWDRVARDLHLAVRDVMVFVLVRKSHFRIALFDAGGEIKKRDEVEVRNSEDEMRMLRASSGIGLNAIVETAEEERDGIAHAELPNQLPVLSVRKTKNRDESPLKPQEMEEEFAISFRTLRNASIAKPAKFESEAPMDAVNAVVVEDAADNEVDPYNPLQSESAMARERVTKFEVVDPFAFEFTSKRRKITAQERQRAGESAVAHAKMLAKDAYYFVCAMTETHVYRDFHLVLPDSFAAATSLPPSPTRLKLLDCAGHAWNVYSKRNACNQFALHRKYWALFALHHFLEEGDVCVFALQETEPARSVLVHIFRVVALSSTDTTSVHSHYQTHDTTT